VESPSHTMPALATRLTPFSRKPKPQAQSYSILRRRLLGRVRRVFCRPRRVLVGSGVEPVLSHRRRWEYPNSWGSLAVQVRQLDYRRPAATNAIPLPQPKHGLLTCCSSCRRFAAARSLGISCCESFPHYTPFLRAAIANTTLLFLQSSKIPECGALPTNFGQRGLDRHHKSDGPAFLWRIPHPRRLSVVV
jgi:hypothetical protein